MNTNGLKSKKLAAAVAEKQGCEWQWDTNASPVPCWFKDAELFSSVPGYRPDIDIAQAWELDGEGWLWDMTEGIGGVCFIVSVNDALPDPVGRARWADFPTKAHATATARCRAYLKAMGKH